MGAKGENHYALPDMPEMPSQPDPKQGFTWRELLVVLSFIAVLYSLLMPAVRQARGPIDPDDVGKPAGLAIPDELPSESNRVTHAQGFSIVLPPNWKIAVETGTRGDRAGRLLCLPRHPGRRARAMLTLTRYGTRDEAPSDLALFRGVRFQGQSAFANVEHRGGEKAYLEYSLVFQHDGEWYALIYRVGENLAALPPVMPSYFATFRPPNKSPGEMP